MEAGLEGCVEMHAVCVGGQGAATEREATGPPHARLQGGGVSGRGRRTLL